MIFIIIRINFYLHIVYLYTYNIHNIYLFLINFRTRYSRDLFYRSVEF